MTTTDIFERATRTKVRFPYKGSCSVEDLWDLSVQELDKMFKSINAELKVEREESLLDQNKISSILELKAAIIRRIVQVKLDEAAAAEQEVARRQKKDRILSILARKQDAKMEAMSEEELARMLDEL